MRGAPPDVAAVCYDRNRRVWIQQDIFDRPRRVVRCGFVGAPESSTVLSPRAASIAAFASYSSDETPFGLATKFRHRGR